MKRSRISGGRRMKCLVLYGAMLAAGIAVNSASVYAALEYQKTYGTSRTENAFHPLEVTKDGGYIMAGSIDQTTPGATNPDSDVYLVKTNAGGALLWSKRIGLSGSYETANDVHQTTDGGYVTVGMWDNWTGGTSTVWSSADIYVVRTDATGNRLWSRRYGIHRYYEEGFGIQETSDRGFIIVGYTSTYEDSEDVMLIKIDAAGNIQWSKKFASLGNNERGYSVQQTSDGGYVVTGSVTVGGYMGLTDVLLFKTNSSGALQWQRRFGRSGNEIGYSVYQTADGGYAVAGVSDGGVTGRDMLVAKTNSSGVLTWANACHSGSSSEEARDIRQSSDLGYIVGGTSSGAAMLKLSSAGAVQWSKRYVIPTTGTVTASGRSVCVRTDGYALAGLVTGVGAGLQDFVLVRTNLSGVLGCNVNNLTTTTTAITSQAVQSLSVSGWSDYNNNHSSTSLPVTVMNQQCYRFGLDDPYPPKDIGINDKMSHRLIIPGAPHGFINDDFVGDAPIVYGQVWNSEEIWVRNTKDAILTTRTVGDQYEHELEHQNPIYHADGSSNYVYVMITNRGTEDSPSASLKVYWSRASSNLRWTEHWSSYYDGAGYLAGDQIAEVTIPEIPPGEIYVAEIPWTVPNPSNFGEGEASYSLLARIESTEDPMAVAERDVTEENALNNNNIAMRSDIIVSKENLSDDDPGHVKHVVVRNGTSSRANVNLKFQVPSHEQSLSPLISADATVKVDLGPTLYNLWRNNGGGGSGVQDNLDGTITMTAQEATLTGIPFNAGQEFTVGVSFSYSGDPLPPSAYFHYDMLQYSTGAGEPTGGVTFEVNLPDTVDTTESSGPDTTEGKRTMPGLTNGAELAGYSLSAHPNPARGAATISFTLPVESEISVAIHNSRGELVRVLRSEQVMAAGHHEMHWRGDNDAGDPLESGIYFYSLTTKEGVLARRITLIR